MSLIAIAWDVDGTLVDSEPLHHRALLAASLAVGVDLSDIPEERFLGVHMNDVWTALMPRLPATLRKQDWLAAIEAYYALHRAELTPMPGAIETIRRLKERGIAQACVSNSARLIVDANLDALGIADCMAFSISLDDVARGKPDPLPYAEAVRRLSLAPRHVLAIEDSRTGLASARAAGLVTAGYRIKQLSRDEADHAIENLGDVLHLVGAA